MSPRVSLLALFGCVGVTILLFSLARLDLSRVPTDSSQLELRHSYSDSSSTKHSSGPELLAFIGVQVSYREGCLLQHAGLLSMLAEHPLSCIADRLHY